MRQNFWDKKIPTLLGIVLLVVGIGVTTFLVKQGGIFSIRASLSQEPKNVRISNVTDNSFTVSYQTDDLATGVLNFGKDQSLGQSGLDDRDQESGNIVEHKIHNFTLRNLEPKTTYYFSIISGKDTYLNNDSPYEGITGQSITDTPLAQNPISGTLMLSTGKPPAEGIVYVTTQGAQVISTLIKTDGTYILPLNSLENSDFTSYFELNNNVLKLLAVGDGLTSNATLTAGQVNPIPAITLPNNYDFTTSTTPVASQSANIETFPSFSNATSEKADKNPGIVTPQKDQGFTDQQPQFKGTAPANEQVEITIHSDEQIQTTVKADANGNWTYRPPNDLSPGNHTITIAVKNAQGVLQTITQSFVVYAAGSQIAGDEGSPTPTPNITNTPTPTEVPVVEQNPTVTPIESNTPTPTTTVLISTSPTELPATGNPIIITAGIVGAALSILGGILFLLSRGAII